MAEAVIHLRPFREGVLRAAGFRGGQGRDSVVDGLLGAAAVAPS